MASHGFVMWYQARQAREASAMEASVAAEALSEWAGRTDTATPSPQRQDAGKVDMRTKKGRALKAAQRRMQADG